jgi:hypothetical protein
MSAFVVDKEDIDVLVTAYLGLHEATARTANKLGQTLWTENVNSVAYRYNMPERHGVEYLGYRRAVRDYAYAPVEADSAKIASTASCFDYQSCEHDAWETSEAKRIVDLISAVHARKAVR